MTMTGLILLSGVGNLVFLSLICNIIHHREGRVGRTAIGHQRKKHLDTTRLFVLHEVRA